MTLRQCATELAEHLATPKPAGCGACGDDCKDRGSCRLADESPKPASAVPLPEEFAHVCNDGYWLLRVAGTARFDIPDTRFGGHAQSVYSRDQLTTYGDAREAAGRADSVPAGAVRKLVFSARTSGGTAGRDEGLCAALDEVESLLASPQPVTTQGEARPRVFIDMDGVIVDFDAYKTANGLTGDEVKRTPGAYLAMPAIPGAIAAVRSVIDMGFEVWIATKPPTGVPGAYSDKAAWVMEHLPELKRRIIVTHDKGLLGNAGDFLCDDRPHKANCERFAGTLLRFVDGYHWPQALDSLRARRLTGSQP